MKHIIIHECYDKIHISNNNGTNTITNSQAHELDILVKNLKLDKENVIWGRNNITFINYVGFIKLPSFSIEILPKVSMSNEQDDYDCSRKVLINMLSKSSKIDINYSELNSHKIYKKSLFEIFAFLFASKLESELRRGIQLEYIEKEENIYFQKGKVLLKEQIQNKAKNNSKSYCRYEEFESNNTLNKVFKNAIELLIPNIKNIDTINKLKYCASYYTSVEKTYISNNDLDGFQFNRMNKRFEPAFYLAKMFLKSYSPTSALASNKSFSLLFKMNELFEIYIAKTIKKNINHFVSMQDKRYKLLINEQTTRKSFPIKPDIVIEHEGAARLIIDTKWKRISSSYHRHGLKREDLYQMYAYLTRYEDSTSALLLYPHNPDISAESGDVLESWFLENQNNKKLKLYSIDLRNESITIEILKRIINDNI